MSLPFRSFEIRNNLIRISNIPILISIAYFSNSDSVNPPPCSIRNCFNRVDFPESDDPKINNFGSAS